MGLHNIYDGVTRGSFPSGIATDPNVGPIANAIGRMFPTSGPADRRTGHMQAYGDTVPSGVAGFAPGCLFVQVNPTTNTQSVFINTGTILSCTFTKISAIENDEQITFRVSLHASAVIYNIFNADRAYQVTSISYTTNIVQAITATLVKSTVNATPASATTPLHIAGAINANTTVHNGTTVALTATAADLLLAATNKISIVLSAALTTGDFTVNIGLKRI